MHLRKPPLLGCSGLLFTYDNQNIAYRPHLFFGRQNVVVICLRRRIGIQPVTPVKKQNIAYSGCDNFYLGVTPESKNLLGEQQ
tara:strand:+ start:405 stop:653 length:249 start_codon:yes stop_codon:yes gene_type:complete